VDNLVLVTFDSEAKAYQGLSQMKQLSAAGALELHEAAVTLRGADGQLVIKESVGFDSDAGQSTGSIVGMFIGLLGGPLGLLFGWITGGLIGASTDAAHAVEATSALAFVGRALPAGSTALLAAVGEPTPDALDAMVGRLGGHLVRQPAEAVQAAIVAATRAQAAAHEAARKAIQEGAPGERHSKWEDIKASFKRAFMHSPATPVAPKDGSSAGARG